TILTWTTATSRLNCSESGVPISRSWTASPPMRRTSNCTAWARGRSSPGVIPRSRCTDEALIHPPAGESPRAFRWFNRPMVVIFGFGAGRPDDLGEVVPAVCPNCHNQVFLHHVRSKKSVRLYFVPVVPYGTDDYLVCPVCSQGLQLSAPQLPKVRSMSAAVTAYRTGRLSQAQLMAQAEAFWRQLGVSSAGPRPPAPPGRGAYPPAQQGIPPQPAVPPQPAPAPPAQPAVAA